MSEDEGGLRGRMVYLPLMWWKDGVMMRWRYREDFVFFVLRN